MNETTVTAVGHVATEPTLRKTSGGAMVASFRLASTERRFDKGTNSWRDGNTTFFTVTTWRNAAENVAESVTKGQPVVVHGRLRDSSYDSKDGHRRTVLEIEAWAVGHDLSKGVATFRKSTVSSASESNVVRELDELERVDPVTGELLDADFDEGPDRQRLDGAGLDGAGLDGAGLNGEGLDGKGGGAGDSVTSAA